MPALQSLKKQLRGIRSTQKLTKAMKTVSTVKFSKLNGIYGAFSAYGEQCGALLKQYGNALVRTLGDVCDTAPALILVLTGNKGLCGSFNAEVLKYFAQTVQENPNAVMAACGKKAAAFATAKGMELLFATHLSDLPTFEESSGLFDRLAALRQAGKVSRVLVVYPRYKNMMTQIPTVCDLFAAEGEGQESAVLCVPDEQTVQAATASTVMRAQFYHLALQTALGAQAATLMTMRSAYDTATEYCAELEGQINRKRQSAVTADVIETSAERSE